jgi:predicted SprT family Zn-dependent metalloprotease
MKLNKILLVLSIIIPTLFIYNLFYSKLFPLSPIAIGFEKHELSNTIIYIQNGSNYTNYKEIDKYTESVESFHKLKFQKKPKICVFSDKKTYLRRNITNARFYAYPNGRLVVSPWAVDESQKGIISLEIYIKHELSHVLLYQNMSYLAAYYYPKWLLEGIAVYSTNQMGTSWYPSKKKTYEIIKSGDYFPPNLYKTIKEDGIKIKTQNRIAFMYSEFGCIVDFLIAKYGQDKFYQYMNNLFLNYNHDESFKDIYHTDFDSFLNDFKATTNK